MPTPRRVGLWLGLGAVVVAGAVVALYAGASSSRPPAPAARPMPISNPPLAPPSSSPAPSPPPVPGADIAHAARLTTEAAAEATAGNYAQARSLFQQAYALDPEPATLFQIATVEHQLGRCREARRTTQRVIAAAPGDPLAGQAQTLLDQIGRCD